MKFGLSTSLIPHIRIASVSALMFLLCEPGLVRAQTNNVGRADDAHILLSFNPAEAIVRDKRGKDMGSKAKMSNDIKFLMDMTPGPDGTRKIYADCFRLMAKDLPVPHSGTVTFGASVNPSKTTLSVSIDGRSVWKHDRDGDVATIASPPIVLAEAGVTGTVFRIDLNVGEDFPSGGIEWFRMSEARAEVPSVEPDGHRPETDTNGDLGPSRAD